MTNISHFGRTASRQYALCIEIPSRTPGRKRYYRISKDSYRLASARLHYQPALLDGFLYGGIVTCLRPIRLATDDSAPGLGAIYSMIEAGQQ